MEEPGHDVPEPLDLLWGLRAGPARERKRGLTAERIVGAAVELADAGGLEAVSMSRVAERLGFTTMSLYRHVRGKDELLALMADAEPPAPPDDASVACWRDGLERWTWDLLGLIRRHPWLMEVPLGRLPFGPNRFAWLDRGLRALAGTALSEDEKAAVILLLNGYAFSEARLAAEVAGRPREGGWAADAAVALPAALATLLDPERFPALRRAVDAGIFDPSGSDPDADFAFGLERILDGIDLLVARRAEGA
jgi:AcrR family transcriptional regulator